MFPPPWSQSLCPPIHRHTHATVFTAALICSLYGNCWALHPFISCFSHPHLELVKVSRSAGKGFGGPCKINVTSWSPRGNKTDQTCRNRYIHHVLYPYECLCTEILKVNFQSRANIIPCLSYWGFSWPGGHVALHNIFFKRRIVTNTWVCWGKKTKLLCTPITAVVLLHLALLLKSHPVHNLCLYTHLSACVSLWASRGSHSAFTSQ